MSTKPPIVSSVPFLYCPHCGHGQNVDLHVEKDDILECPRCGFYGYSVAFSMKPMKEGADV